MKKNQGIEIERGMEVDVEKWREWNKGRRLADIGALMCHILPEALERNDRKFLKQFPWIKKIIERPKVKITTI